MDLTFYHGILEPSPRGFHGILAVHLIGRCNRWPASAAFNDKGDSGLLEVISKHWINMFGDMKTLSRDGEAGVN